MKTTINWTKDKKYFKEGGDPGFSPARNKHVIESTIKKYDAIQAQKVKDFTEALMERTDAAVSYLRNDKAILSDKSFGKYLGSKNLAYMRGQDIVHKLKMANKPTFTPQDIIRVTPQLTDFHRNG